MNMSARVLLLVSSGCFVIPFILSAGLGYVTPLTDMAGLPTTVGAATWMLGMVGSWVGVITFVLGILNWNK